MSWTNVWPLPRRGYSKAEVAAAIRQALTPFAGAELDPVDPDLVEFEDDFAADEAEDGDARSFEHWIRFSSEDGPECLLLVDRGDETGWAVRVDGSTGSNDAAAEDINDVAARVSVLLGGASDCAGD